MRERITCSLAGAVRPHARLTTARGAFANPTIRPFDRAPAKTVVSSSAQKELTMIAIVPEQLTHATFVAPSTIELEFGDGLRCPLAIDLLGMPLDRIDWPTLEASPGGEKIVVKGIKGDAVPIDAGTLRYLVDKKYAARIDKSLASLRLSRDELAEMARDNPPSPEWYDESGDDFTRESWK